MPLRTVRELGGRGGYPIIFIKSADVLKTLAVEVGLVEPWGHRHEERHNDTGHRGVDAGIVEERPDRDGRNQIEPASFLTQLIHQQHQSNQHKRYAQKSEVDCAAVEQSHYQNGDEIIRYGQRGQENFQRNRNPVTKNGQDAHGESDVSGCRNTPAGSGRRAMIDCGEDQCGSHHAAERRDHGHHGLLHAGQFPVLHLASDLQTDGKEEDRHQDVVDELLDRHSVREQDALPSRTLESQRDVRLQEVMVKLFGERKIGQKHRHNDTAKQQDTLRPRQLGKLLPSMVKVPDAFGPGVNRK